MHPIQIPAEWDDNGILLFEEFCAFIRTPQRTVRDWKTSRHRTPLVAVQRHRPALHHRR